jgi:hypothetical protein
LASKLLQKGGLLGGEGFVENREIVEREESNWVCLKRGLGRKGLELRGRVGISPTTGN